MGLLNALKSGLSSIVGQSQRVVHEVSDQAKKVEHFAEDRFDDAKKAAGQLINRAAQANMNAAVAVSDGVRGLASHGVDDVQAFSNRLIDSTQSFANDAVDSGQRFANHLVDTTQHAAGGVIDTAQRLTNEAIDTTQDFANGAVDTAQNFVNRAVDGAQAQTLGWLNRLPGPVGAAARTASRTLDGAQRVGSTLVDGGQGLLSHTVDGAQSTASGAITGGKRAAASALNGAQSAASLAVDGTQQLAGRATDVTQRVAGSAVDAQQAALAQEARMAQRVAIFGLHTAGSAARPFVLPQLSGAHQVLAGGTDVSFDGDLIGAGGQVYAPGTPLRDIAGVMPRSGAPANETILYVNGISTTEAAQSRDLQTIADATGAKVIGLHNSTEGFLADGAQVFTDKLAGQNSAVASLANTIHDELRAGRPVHLMAHSQGGLVTSRALSAAKERLINQDGMSRADAERLLGNVTCETFAAAARNYPDGPKYIHTINRLDVVPGLLGLGPGLVGTDFDSHPGRGAVIRYFTGNLVGHGLIDEYLPHRQAP